MRAKRQAGQFGNFARGALSEFRMRVEAGADGGPADGQIVEAVERNSDACPVAIKQADVTGKLLPQRERRGVLQMGAPDFYDVGEFFRFAVKGVAKFGQRDQSAIQIYVTSFGFRNGVPPDSDLVFDVRFLPNPNYIPRFKNLTGKNPGVARYIRSFPQTAEFMSRISDLLIYLLPHYIREGKSYLTISFGSTGGQHRSVMMADEVRRTLSDAGFKAKVNHRDIVNTP